MYGLMGCAHENRHLEEMYHSFIHFSVYLLLSKHTAFATCLLELLGLEHRQHPIWCCR